MPRYKITKVFVVDAPDKQQALSKLKIEQDALNHLEYVSVKEDQPPAKGWASALKNQLTGAKK